MSYDFLKAAHVASVLVFVGGLVLLLVANRITASATPGSTASLQKGVLRWDRRITSPALLLAWVFGIWIAVQSGAFSAPWLQLKLVLVVVLSALHGMLSGRLRRNNPAGPMRVQIQSIIVVAGLIGVAFLAVVKPF